MKEITLIQLSEIKAWKENPESIDVTGKLINRAMIIELTGVGMSKMVVATSSPDFPAETKHRNNMLCYVFTEVAAWLSKNDIKSKTYASAQYRLGKEKREYIRTGGNAKDMASAMALMTPTHKKKNQEALRE